MPRHALLLRPRRLFLVMAALTGLTGVAGPADASAAVPAPTLELLAGTGVPGYLGDGGPAIDAQLDQPMGVAVDAAGNVLVADLSNRIRKITPDGVITTVAGSGIAGFAGDGGPATDAQLNHPTGVIVDATGGILIADQHNHRIRRVDPSGTITTVAGTGFAGNRVGDGGPALQAELNLPTTLALDAEGGILIAEMGERLVRRIDPDGTLTTIAGDGASGYDGDNKPATEASLTKPTGLAVTRAGDVLIADQGDQRVRRVDPTGVIHTIAGTGLAFSTGDGGPASAASLSSPRACSWTARVACSLPKADRAPRCARSSATARSTPSPAAARAHRPTGSSRPPRSCRARPAWSSIPRAASSWRSRGRTNCGRCARRGRAAEASWLHSAAPASVAQLVEHFTRNEGVSGSSPLGGSTRCAAAAVEPPPRDPGGLVVGG